MRIYLNRSLNKHYTGGTRVTIRRQLPIVRPGCWQQHKQLVGTRPQGVPGLGGLVPGVPSSGLFPYENQPATGAARRHEGDARIDVV